MKRKSLGRFAALLVVVGLFLGFSGQAEAASIPDCSAASSITDPTLQAPEKIPAGRKALFGFWLNPDKKVGSVSQVEATLTTQKRKLTWKSDQPWKRRLVRLNLGDQKSQFRVSWIEETQASDEQSSTRCRRSVKKSFRVWKGNVASFKYQTVGTNVEWQLNNWEQLCRFDSYATPLYRSQTAPGYYQMRIRGLGGHVRSTILDICDGFTRERGKESSKWNLYYWDYRYFKYWEFSLFDLDMPVGNYPIKWSIYHKKRRLQHGLFSIRVRLR
ncbi:MAG TPA: hypothetical protein PKD76_12435 [Solirubrobacterales bacterium]|nr:hypothetical protein [Solirubrobacterales bacterium]